jgi:hypothetical protein
MEWTENLTLQCRLRYEVKTKTSYAMKSRYYFLFHTLSGLSILVRLKHKNKMILIKYSRPIGMFPATQFWVATHRLRTTVVEPYGYNAVWNNNEHYRCPCQMVKITDVLEELNCIFQSPRNVDKGVLSGHLWLRVGECVVKLKTMKITIKIGSSRQRREDIWLIFSCSQPNM